MDKKKKTYEAMDWAAANIVDGQDSHTWENVMSWLGHVVNVARDEAFQEITEEEEKKCECGAGRPAFLVDDKLKDASKKAKKAFECEEEGASCQCEEEVPREIEELHCLRSDLDGYSLRKINQLIGVVNSLRKELYLLKKQR